MSEKITKQVEKLATILLKNNLKIATAESCTGGMLSQYFTSLNGSSDWFDRGFVTYSNKAKIEMLGVNQNTIEKFGAVSKKTVLEMAQGTLKNSEANITISISGIAGPEGGSKEKPVGTVFFGLGFNLNNHKKNHSFHKMFSGDRLKVRKNSCEFAIKKIIEKISDI